MDPLCKISKSPLQRSFWYRQSIYVIFICMNKQVITDIFLTKEAFEQYTLRLQEERAAEYGMTLEEWKHAVASGSVINPKTND